MCKHVFTLQHVSGPVGFHRTSYRLHFKYELKLSLFVCLFLLDQRLDWLFICLACVTHLSNMSSHTPKPHIILLPHLFTIKFYYRSQKRGAVH